MTKGRYGMMRSSRRLQLPRYASLVWLASVLAFLGSSEVPRSVRAEFIRGDATGDGVVDIADPILTLASLFGGSTATLPCDSAGDSNDDGNIDIADPVRTLGFLFSAGPPPSPPFPGCGDDPTTDILTCLVPPPSCTVTGLVGLTFSSINAQGFEEYALDLDPTVVLILVPGGTFGLGQVGWAEPVHSVTLSPYLIGKHEITNAQYRLYCDLNSMPYPLPPTLPNLGLPIDHFTNPIYDDHPVAMVTWVDLMAPGGYLDWAGLTLPTEAQWEFAARGTDGRSYPWGNEGPDDGGIFRANHCPAPSNCDLDGWAFTSPVGVAPFSTFEGPFGTRDQAGNLWEWCRDWYAEYDFPATPAVDPTGPLTGATRIQRGCSWYPDVALNPSAYRANNFPNYYFENVGFRVVRPMQ